MSLGLSTAVFAGAQHAYLYKDARIMSMGGANVAVGGYSTSVFANPAGLASIKKDHGLEIELLGLSVGGSVGFQDFANDITDALDIEDEEDQFTAIANVIENSSGNHYQLDISNYSSVSHNGDWLAWSVGLLIAEDTALLPHAKGGFGTPTGVMGLQSRAYAGLVTGFAKSFNDVGPGQLDIGIGAKYIQNESVQKDLTLAEVTDLADNSDRFIEDNLHESSAFGFDLGLNYKMFQETPYPTTFSMSILNMGGLTFDSETNYVRDDNESNPNYDGYSVYGDQPTTLNFGVSVSPDVPWFEHLILAADYVDALNANTYYVINSSGATEYAESDFMKRFRLGASFGVIDNSWFMLTLNAGLYQAAYTAGIDMQMTVVKLSAATYAEETGLTGSETSTSDRRYVVSLGIGW